MSCFDVMPTRRGSGSLKWDQKPELRPFWVADMDFQSPPEVIEALKRRVEHGVFGYAVPHDGLIESILDYLRERHEVFSSPDELVHLGGLVPALSLACRAFAEKNESVLTCTPIYPPFLHVHKDANLNLTTVPYIVSEGKWTFDWEALEEAVKKLNAEIDKGVQIQLAAQDPIQNLFKNWRKDWGRTGQGGGGTKR